MAAWVVLDGHPYGLRKGCAGGARNVYAAPFSSDKNRNAEAVSCRFKINAKTVCACMCVCVYSMLGRVFIHLRALNFTSREMVWSGCACVDSALWRLGFRRRASHQVISWSACIVAAGDDEPHPRCTSNARRPPASGTTPNQSSIRIRALNPCS
jgi:hypothetical protein